MKQKVLQFCKRHKLFAPHDTVVVAVSGGADSVATLRVLHELRDQLPLRLFVAHLNHGFRGDAARGDLVFVEKLCKELGIPFYGREVNVPEILRSTGGSTQDVSRLQRLMFFTDITVETGAKSVILGHHKDDQTETVLLHLIRGSGANGLRGMVPRSSFPDFDLVRPLLCVNRREVEAYLSELGQSYRTDASNLTEDYDRNYLRSRVLPPLRYLNSNLDEAVGRLSFLLGEDDAELSRQAEQIWGEIGSAERDVVVLASEPFCTLNLALSQRVVRRAWREMTGGLHDLELVHVSDIIGLCERQVGRFINLPGGISVFREPGRLCFRLAKPSKPYSFTLTIPGEIALPGQALIRAEVVRHPTSASEHMTVYVSTEAHSLTVRSRLPGDRYSPAGFSGRRKIKDMHREAAVHLALRDLWPVITDGEDIVWTPGARVSDRFKSNSDSEKKVVRLTYVTGGTEFAL